MGVTSPSPCVAIAVFYGVHRCVSAWIWVRSGDEGFIGNARTFQAGIVWYASLPIRPFDLHTYKSASQLVTYKSNLSPTRTLVETAKRNLESEKHGTMAAIDLSQRKHNRQMPAPPHGHFL